MNCQRLQQQFQKNMDTLISKYENNCASKENLQKLLLENTNFVMSIMLQECLNLSAD